MLRPRNLARPALRALALALPLAFGTLPAHAQSLIELYEAAKNFVWR